MYEARKEGAQLAALRAAADRTSSITPTTGWGSYAATSTSATGTIRFTPIFAIDNADDLVEEYSGFGLRFETRKLGTQRLGASLEWTSFDEDWQAATLDAVALNPGDSAAVRTAIDDHAIAEVRVQSDISASPAA